MPRRPAAPALLVGLLLTGLLLAGCGYLGTGRPLRGRLSVVAAENFWGSIAAQLGGRRVVVHSVIVDPGVDPHSYTSTPADAIAFAGARLAIVNGIGYDPWASRLVAAAGIPSHQALDVGRLLGLSDGDNPHQWYSPSSVRRVVDAVTGELVELDPAGRAYYERRHRDFVGVALGAYQRLLAEIRRRYGGVPVGYSESIFAPLSAALGLRLLTPARFAKAIAEGTDVAAADLQTVETQAREHRIAVWVYNQQNETPDVARANAAARVAGIPVVKITETLDPASATFQAWQIAQLRALASALRRATGR